MAKGSRGNPLGALLVPCRRSGRSVAFSLGGLEPKGPDGSAPPETQRDRVIGTGDLDVSDDVSPLDASNFCGKRDAPLVNDPEQLQGALNTIPRYSVVTGEVQVKV